MESKYKNISRDRNEDQYRNASITVEAAFIMPLILFLLFALIYLSFILYDICRIQGGMDRTLHQYGLSLKHETDAVTGRIRYEEIGKRGVFYLLTDHSDLYEKRIEADITDQLTKGLLLVKIASVEATVGKFSITIAIEASYQVPVPFAHALLEPYSNILLTGSYPIHDPVETIRRCEVILDTASDIKGVDEMKEKIEKFLNKKD